LKSSQIPDALKYKNRPLDISYLRRTDAIHLPLTSGEDARAFKTWFKALFDKNSEGVEDDVIR
jgi:mediator of RNA polymerase II transcription subunit 5